MSAGAEKLPGLDRIIAAAFDEDVREGDHTSLACIGPDARGTAKLLVKAGGVLAGVDVARAVFAHFDPRLDVRTFFSDGSPIRPGDVVFTVTGSALSILSCERIVLNLMQRMSGIATLTRQYVEAVAGTGAKVIDTRKTIPGIRVLEKRAVELGGGGNHRMGLYDMIMIKDNHIDFCGGITRAIGAVTAYQSKHGLNLKVEVETRNLAEVEEVLACGGVDRIMLDNFSPARLSEAVARIGGRYETEASGGITLENIAAYAASGVDFISCGALTHSAVALDLSLKATVEYG